MKKLKICFLVFVLVLGISFLSFSVKALDVWANNGSAVAIQAAVDQVAAAGGGNVHIPAGTYNFYEPGKNWIAVGVPAGVNIFGAPTERDEKDQVIKWKTRLVMPFIPPNNARFFNINGDSDPDKPIRFSDIEMIGYRAFHLNDPGANENITIAKYRGIVLSNIVDFRVDHCLFNETADGGIWIGGVADCNIRGVIDHNKFINEIGIPAGPWNNSDIGQAYRERTLGYGIGIGCVGSSIWDSYIENVLGQYGLSKTTGEVNVAGSVYIEDNYFSRWRHCVSSGHGAHYVFRHNIVENDCGSGSIDGHGVYVNVGTRCMEFYENQFLDPVNCWEGKLYWSNRMMPTPTHLRGPLSGIIFNNYVRGYRLYELPDYPEGHGSFLHHLPEGGYPTDWWYWNNTLEPDTTPFWNWAPQYYYFVEPHPTTFPTQLPGPTSQGTPSVTYEPYPYPHPLTLGETPTTSSTTTLPGQVTISGELSNSTGTIEALVTLFNPGTSQVNESESTVGGSYSRNIWPGIYDLQYSIYHIPNFFIKLISLSINSNLQGIVNDVNSLSNGISFEVNITEDQEIQVYSDEEPVSVKANGIELTKETTLPSLGEWTYSSGEIRMIVSPTSPTTTTTSTSTTIETTTETTSTTLTTTPPGTEKTFGNTNIGDGLSSNPAGYLSACKFTAPEDGTITKITSYIWQKNGPANAKTAIYADNGGTPGILLVESNEVALPTSGDWVDFNMNLPINENTDYWLAIFAGGEGVRYMYDPGDPNQLAYTWGNTYDTFPNPFDENYGPNYHDWDMSIYATYTTS